MLGDAESAKLASSKACAATQVWTTAFALCKTHIPSLLIKREELNLPHITENLKTSPFLQQLGHQKWDGWGFFFDAVL